MKKLILICLFASLSSGCATYKLMKEEVFPCVGDCLVQTGPKLMLAVWDDVKDIIGTPTGFVEGLLIKDDAEDE